LTGSTVELGNAAELTGGTLTTAGTGQIRALSGASVLLRNLTNAGALGLVNTAVVTLEGTLTNTGNVQLNSTGAATQLRVTGNVSLTGGGTVTLGTGSATGNRIVGVAAAHRLTNVNNTIQGRGLLGNATMGLTNEAQGTILANNSSTLDITPSAAGFTNHGTLQADAGSTLRITNANFTNFAGTTLTGGIYNVAGTFRFSGANIATNAAKIVLDGPTSQILNHTNGANALANFATNALAGDFTIQNGRNLTTAAAFSNAGKVTIGTGTTFMVGPIGAHTYTQTTGETTVEGTLKAGTVDLLGGILKGSGTVIGTINNSGAINPGSSPGVLHITGDYNQSGVLRIEIADVSLFDQLDITGQAQLLIGSTLDIDPLGTFVPQVGQTFRILSAASRSGTFTNILDEDLGGGFFFNVVYDATGVTLQVQQTQTPIPEPSTYLMVLSGVLGLAWYRYRARSRFVRR
jgi:hypothetical protein